MPSSPRRSGRDRKSTITYIGGQAVLKTNNYVVKGTTYVYSKDDAQQAAPVKRVVQHQPSTTKEPKKPRLATPAELGRRAHNASVEQQKASKQAARQSFLRQHDHILQPFMADSVWNQIQSYPQITHNYDPVYQQPSEITGELRDYQLLGLDFMVRNHKQNLGMILGDEMGLGKTLQTISLLCYLKETEKKKGPSLVICPLSVLSSWCNELKRWAPHLKFLRLHSPSQEEQESQRKTLAEKGHTLDVIVTTYEMAKVPVLHSAFSRLHFHYLVLDEGHKIKAHTTQIAQAVRKIHCENKLLLTGTPLQNNMYELWSLLEFLYPEVFTTPEPFDSAFNISENHVDTEMLCKAQKVLDLFMLRRLKKQVEKLMPPKLETKVYCPLAQTQIFWYKAILMKDLQSLCKYDEASGEIGQNSSKVLKNLFMQLRKASQHPFLFNGAEQNINATTVEELTGASGKLAVLDMLLRSLCVKGHRAILFSQFTMVLDILEDYCRMRGWKYARFDGSTSRAKRTYLVNQFNAPDSPFFLFLMSTKSGGMGLNLQSADTCILYDSDWNPQNDLQAMARVHRIGQKKTVHVYRLVSAGTVEERIVERAEKKLLLDQTVNRENRGVEDDMGGLSAKELLKDIKFGCAAIFGENAKNELPSWNDIDQITNRARKESDSVGKLKGGATKDAATFDAEKELSVSQMFGGVDFRKIRAEQDRKARQALPQTMKGIGHLWQEVSNLKGKRAVKSRIVYLNGKNSGYGMKSVPVLASNNYDLEHGESSVFDRELSHKKFAVPNKKKASKKFENQEHCQVCLDGGYLVLCPRCPVSLHLKCCGITRHKDFQCCPHHNCVKCKKSVANAGGILYPCAVCVDSYCEDCLPRDREGFRVLGALDRFEDLGYDSTKQHAYIHCSKDCEKFARQEQNWSPGLNKQICPEALDLSSKFGASKIVMENPKADEKTKDPANENPPNAQQPSERSFLFETGQGQNKWQEGPRPSQSFQRESVYKTVQGHISSPPSNLGETSSEGTARQLMIPPGKLGISVEGPVIRFIYEDSVLKGKVWLGESIIAVDDIVTRDMPGSAISALLIKTANQQQRRLTLLGNPSKWEHPSQDSPNDVKANIVISSS